MTGRTDLWSIDASGGDSGAAWWATKDAALQAVRVVRRADGCNCEAPPWVSPPAEWPLRIRLDHHPSCGEPIPEDTSPLGRLAAKHRAPVAHLSAEGIQRADDPRIVAAARAQLGPSLTPPAVTGPAGDPPAGLEQGE